MDTEDFLEFMIDNPYYWGVDRIVLAEQMAKVFKAQEKVWSEGNIGYSSMEGYGIKWVAYGDMKDDNRCVLGLKVNK